MNYICYYNYNKRISSLQGKINKIFEKSISGRRSKIVCFVELLVIGQLLYTNNKPVDNPDVPIIEIVRDSIIRDSIFIEVEKIKREIVYVKEQFKQDSLDIMSANDSVLFGSFSKYIDDYNNK